MFPLSKFFDHLFVECPDVIGLAARDESHGGDDFFVDPIPARIPNIGTQRRPGRRVRPSYFLQRQGSFMLDVLLIEMTNTLSLFNGRLSFKKIRDAKWRRPFWEEEGGP